MKVFKLLIIGSLSLLILFSCKDDDKEIIGMWTASSHKLKIVTDNSMVSQYLPAFVETLVDFDATTFNFEPDSCTITFYGSDGTPNGYTLAYRLNDNTIFFYEDSLFPELTLEMPYKFKKKQLLLNIDILHFFDAIGILDEMYETDDEIEISSNIPVYKFEQFELDLTLDKAR